MYRLFTFVILALLFSGCSQKDQTIQDIKDHKNIPKIQLFEKTYKF